MVPVATPKWSSIGIDLLNDNTQIDTIALNNPGNSQKCCQQMFAIWLDKNPQATWQKLLNALESDAVGLNALALKVKKSKCAKLAS